MSSDFPHAEYVSEDAAYDYEFQYECPNPDFVHDALVEFIRKIKAVREAHDALTFAESKLIIMDLVQSLLEIAYQVMRTVPWTDRAITMMKELRSEIDGLDNWGYYLDSLQWNLCTRSNEQYVMSVRRLFDLPIEESVFSFGTLSICKPELHEEYITKLNDLLTLCFGYERGSELKIAKQAVKIGRRSCSLADTLLKIIDENTFARRLAIYTANFSVHLLIAPMLKKDFVVCQNCVRNEDREGVWEILRGSNEYTEAEIARLEHYTIISLNYPFKPDQRIGFAVINHDVMYPLRASKKELAIDFQHPIVLIQHFWINPEYRRLGAGSYLMKHIKTLAASNRYEAIAIAETENMIKTQGFWKAVGFKQSVYLSGWYEIELNQ